MFYLIISNIILFIALIIIVFYFKNLLEDKKRKLYNDILEKRIDEINTSAQRQAEIEKKSIQKDLFQEKQNYYKEKEYLGVLLEEQKSHLNTIIESQKTLIDKELESYKKEKVKENEEELARLYVQKNNELENNFQQLSSSYNDNIQKKLDEVNQISSLLDEYRQKRDSINAAILRERELEEKQDFYRVVLTENDIDDIYSLEHLRDKIHNIEGLSKVIYDLYIRTPMNEMVKRVLGGKEPSGIYKITYIPTGESYIGKSTNVAKRWIEHSKAAFGIGTIAHSTLHTKMAKEGLWKFSFELLEEVPKENLSAREGYYIDFYNTKKMGLNQKNA